ncbi:MAG: hypothetical protein IJS14_12300 [Lentisphaeria bacterium]|nr:hypothetical protein [Lentisphaeria bacterium]
MLHFFERYFAVFAAGALIFLAAPTRSWAEDGELFILNYEDASVSPRAKVVNLTERLRRLVRQCIPGGKKRKTREIFAIFADGKRFKPFTFQFDKQNDLRVILPPSYPRVMSEPAALPRLAGWYLFGRAGKDPDLEKHCRNSWFTVGIARKVLGEMTPSHTPFSGYFPAAYTLTSASRYPTLQSLLETELTPDDTAARLVYEEYCELLVLICARSGLFRSGLLGKILDAVEQDPARRDMPDLFRTLARPHLEAKMPGLFPKGMDREKYAAACEQWFRQELDDLLNLNFLPAPAEKLERLYLAAVQFEGKPKKDSGQEKPDGTVIRGNLSGLVRNWDRLEAPEGIAGAVTARLARLNSRTSPDLKIPLEEVRNALRIFAGMPVPENGSRLLEAERKWFRALERNLALEKMLADAEQECVTPAGRYYLTFHLIDYGKRTSARPLSRLAALLEQAENGEVK